MPPPAPVPAPQTQTNAPPTESIPPPTPQPDLTPEPPLAKVPDEPVRKAIILPDAPKKAIDFAIWQIALERRNFSCGIIDGDFGMRSHRALYHFQKNQNLPLTGELDIETRMHLGKPDDAFYRYVVTEADMTKVQPTPESWREKAKATYLGYNNGWEMLSEKFHTDAKFLKDLNPGLLTIEIGTELTAPNLDAIRPLPKIGSMEVILSQTTVLLYDESSKLIAAFPCSIAADKNKRPNGELKVTVVAPNPNYTFNPTVLVEAAQSENITTKLIIPPGPNNPVGLAWVGLSLPGYGIHGTPDPHAISRTGSHGCFRLANWDAIRLVKAVKIGIPVKITE